jgi:lipoyl(octanoyl) transferase
MQDYVKRIASNEAPQLLWFLQHNSVYTAGTSANSNDILNDNKFPIIQTTRGGKHTYHGPGQRVVYLLLNIKKLHNNKPDIKKFVKQIEKWIIDSLLEIGVKAYVQDGIIGVWVKNEGKEEKIAAIGIRVSKWISFHGIAININTNLSDFDGIIPCGITEYGVTSLERLGYNISIEQFDEILLKQFAKAFNTELSESDLSI